MQNHSVFIDFYSCIIYVNLCVSYVSSSLLSVLNQLINTLKYGQNERDFVPGKPNILYDFLTYGSLIVAPSQAL